METQPTNAANLQDPRHTCCVLQFQIMVASSSVNESIGCRIRSPELRIGTMARAEAIDGDKDSLTTSAYTHTAGLIKRMRSPRPRTNAFAGKEARGRSRHSLTLVQIDSICCLSFILKVVSLISLMVSPFVLGLPSGGFLGVRTRRFSVTFHVPPSSIGISLSPFLSFPFRV